MPHGMHMHPLEHVHANVRTIGTQARRTAGRGESQSDARARGRRARVQPPPAPGASLSHTLAAVLVGLRVCVWNSVYNARGAVVLGGQMFVGGG